MQEDDFEVATFPPLGSLGGDDTGHRLRVCIVTEEILGPVRNGGIASTYYHLSKGLSAHGHEVHVLFLKGAVVQDETPEHWVDHFGEFGVTLHYLDLPRTRLWGPAVEWQQRYAAAYAWLRDREPFDVVHTSEWRGGLVYALMAKRLGLAFRDTLFLVKTSSPHIWNRHYQMSPIERRELVLAAFAEQRCVELADAVIGGSAHLISFMDRIGYTLPPTNVFVQPNIVDFSNVPVTDQRPGEPREPGDVVHTRELVFFGRLEGRKGIEMFCNALDILTERGQAPDAVTFLGKWGAPLATQGGLSVQTYLESKQERWDFPVTVITDRNQPEALSYMCSRDMIAVMPSLIENSTMAVYETLEQRIPFIATAVGGTPELVVEADHARCLVPPKATALADRLGEALEEGLVVARSSFSNEANLETWYGFHAQIGAMVARLGREEAVARLTAGIDAPGEEVETVAYAVLLRRDDDLDHLVDALVAAPPDQVLLGASEAMLRPRVEAARDALAGAGVAVELVECIGQAAGDALNTLMAAQTCDAVVVAHGADVWPRPGFLAAARTGLGHSPDSLFTTFFEGGAGVLGMPMGSDVASQIFTSRAYGPELVAMRSAVMEKLGPFEPYDARFGLVHEFVTRAAEAGNDLMVLPEQLLAWPGAAERGAELATDTVYAYLKAKPLLDRSGLAQRKVLLTALHQADRGGGALGEKLLRAGRAEDEGSQWLMPVEWDRDDVAASGHHRLLVALDEEADEIWLYARGPGERRFTVRGLPDDVQVVESVGEQHDDDHVTLARFPVPPTWDAGTSYPIHWGLFAGEEKQRSVFLRVNKVGFATFVLAGRRPVLSVTALRAVVHRQLRAAQAYAAVAAGSADLVELREVVDLARETGRDDLERDSLVLRGRQLLELSGAGAPGPVDGADVRGHVVSAPDGWSEGDWLVGWAWDRTRPDLFVDVLVEHDDEPVLLVTADSHQAWLDRTTPGLSAHGFRIPVLPELLGGGVVRLTVPLTGAQVAGGLLRVDDNGGHSLLRQAPAEAHADADADADLLVAYAVDAARRRTEGPVPDWRRPERAELAARSRELLDELVLPSAAQRDSESLRSHLSPPAESDGWDTDSWLSGWAWDRSDPQRVLHVVAVLDGHTVFAVAADGFRADLDRTTPGLGRHAFRIPVVPELLEGHRLRLEVWEGRPVRGADLEVVERDEGPMLVPVAEKAAPHPPAPDPHQPARAASNALLARLTASTTPAAAGVVRSHLRRPVGGGWVEGDLLTGWAWDRSDHDRVLHVAVVRDGETLFVAPADQCDPSLDSGTPGLGRHAFRIPALPEMVAVPGRLSLVVWQGRVPVREGALEATSNPWPGLRPVSEET